MTGIYEDAGEYAGERYYELTGNGWFIWFDIGEGFWIISDTLGDKTGPSWAKVVPITGVYHPTLPATGDATVTEI